MLRQQIFIAKITFIILVGWGMPGCADRAGGPLFECLPASSSGIDFCNDLQETETENIVEYLYYYNGAGVATGDINNDGLADIYFTSNQQSNRLYLNKGNLQFEDITEKAGVAGAGKWKTGVTMADVNGDGQLDIYVCQVGQYKTFEGRNQLFINNGDLTFTEKAADYGLDFKGFSTQAAFFDYDRDGDLDMYLLNHSVHGTDIYGRATIRQRTDSLSGDRLYRNDLIAGGRFTDVTAQAGIYSSKIGYGLGIAIGDLDDNGWPDIYVSNDFHENDYLYYNNGDGTFTENITGSVGHTSTFSMGSDIADYNNDGLLDLITLDMKPEDEVILKSSVGADPYNIYRFKYEYGYHYQFPRNMLHLNRGKTGATGATFSEIGQLAGVAATDWSWSALFCDLDNDGWKDLFITNGIWRRPNDLDYLKFTSSIEIQRQATDMELANRMPEGKVTNYLYRNNGDLTFSNQSQAWGLEKTGCTTGAAYADLDRDGDLDLVVNNLNAKAEIWENKARQQPEPRHYLRLQLEQPGPNSRAIGSRVVLYAGGKQITQELYTTRGFQSAVEPVLTFGLGKAQQVDSGWVRWPDGAWQRLGPIKADQLFILKKQTGTALPVRNPVEPLLREITTQSGLNFIHKENNYNDFDREKLIPHQLSALGPCLAVGDCNGDGLEDVFIGGAKGQSGALFLQKAGLAFQRLALPALEADSLFEDADAAWLDADQDGDLDLYVVNGGGEGALLLHRLYLNDGRGNLVKSPDALPAVMANGACVVAADMDGDGDTDIFTGARSIPGSYGLSPASYYFENAGKGRFTDKSGQVAPFLQQLGMVSDACWLPATKTLAVVGEWMPLTLIKTGVKEWKKTEIAHSTGWWNTVHAADIDNDGDEDLLLGNLGLNATVKASEEEPLQLYVADYDHNQSYDPILTYYKQHRQYSYYSKDELFSQLTAIKKKYTDYAPFARQTFDQLFSEEQLAESVQKRVETLQSALAINKGNNTFELRPLPLEAQIAPLFAFVAADFNGDGFVDILAGGNWYEVQPSFGRYDASKGCLLLGDGKGGFRADNNVLIDSQIRKIAILKTGLVLIGVNDEKTEVFSVNSEQ